jgi:superfamily II DNA helicase RecQ
VKTPKLQEVFGGMSLYHWHLYVAGALILGLYCVVGAGTGSGKTIPFALPLLVQDSPDKLVMVISPLNTLKTDQVRCPLAVVDLQTRSSEGQKNYFFKCVSVPLG